MQVERRSFLALGSILVPLLWVEGLGALTLPSRTLQVLGGRCSFCGEHMSKRVTIYGVGGRPPRICNQCISLCLDILEEEGRKVPGAGDWLDQQAVLADPGRGAARVAREAYRKELEHLFGEERAKMTASETKLGDLRRQGIFPTGCSFCERPTDEVENLIAGPATYICDRCVGGVLSLSGALVTLARE